MAANTLSVPLYMILITLTFGHLKLSHFILKWVNEQISSSLCSENELWPHTHTHTSCRFFQFDNTCLFSVLYLNRPWTLHFPLFMKRHNYELLTVPDSHMWTIPPPQIKVSSMLHDTLLDRLLFLHTIIKKYHQASVLINVNEAFFFNGC